MTWPLVALLDRDGVLNVNRAQHVTHIRQWQWLPHAIEGCARLSAAGIWIAIVTNQAAVGRGLLREAELQRIHGHMIRGLVEARVAEPLVLYCRHVQEQRCECRKPRPGMLLEAISRLQVRAEDCVLVGDHIQDLKAAENAGCWSVHVQSGRGRSPVDPPTRYLGSATDIAAAADLLLSFRRQPERVPGD
jgi:D-glycero-D-manno-heptose 1,7-bisphosphate phosphatase